VGREGTYTVRPEKIHLESPDAIVPSGSVSALGHVRDVVYLGSDTKYHVALDAGAELAVIKQNVATSSMEALALKGTAVRLVWEGRHTLAVEAGAPVQTRSPSPDGGA
jgi:putative spermidine/putrescine transport system ATP-binding protein